MPSCYINHEFEALKCRFENQAEQLYRLTQIDLKLFSGFFTLQLAVGGWLATQATSLPPKPIVRIAFLFLDIAIAFVATRLLYANKLRRTEVVENVRKCVRALGYQDTGVYLAGESLDWQPPDAMFPKVRYFLVWYLIGAWTTVVAIGVILISS